jgi:filamentous hemagglutinin family protein
MNHTYRLIWNALLQAWVAVAECTRARGKSGGLLRLAAPALAAALLPGPARALDAGTLPGGGQIVAGSGSLVRSGNTLTIRQGSDKLIAHWQNFDIGSGARVDFQQPGATAVALNRVLGNDASQIFGSLTANGRVFLVNPNGVLFGKSAQVDVGGLVASTLDIKDGDFLKGHYAFGGPGDRAGSRISNEGRLHARDGGAIALLGGRVSNSGVIEARLGSVALAAGEQVTLDFAGDGLLNVKVPKSALAALVENHGTLRADGGSVLLTADAGEALLQTVVNNTGLIEARSLENHSGKIVLLGGMAGGVTQVAGKLDASAPGGAHSGDGGSIETSGAHVNIAAGTVVTTQARQGRSGTWLIDPNDFTVAAKGGNMTGAAVSTALQNNGNFVIQTATMGTAGNGDIFVNDAVSWSSNSTLTLQAERSVKVNAPITATGSGAGLTVLYNDGGGSSGNFFVNSTVSLPTTGSLSINGQSYTLIDSLAGLSNLSGRYALVKDIAASVTAPLGDISGTVEGLGHSISGIDINSAMQFVGLFGQILSSGTVRNLGLSGSVRGYTAGMIAGTNAGNIVNVRAVGSVDSTGGAATGGLVGENTGSIGHGWAEVNVTGDVSSIHVGGLAGVNNGGSISDSHATGAVIGHRPNSGSIGGLVGSNGTTSGGTITHSYATGAVTALGTSATVGGLAGTNNGGSISYAYATGAVTGNSSGGAIQSRAGGLVGFQSGGSLNEVWASGMVSAQYAGGLVGWKIGSVTVNAAYWDTQTTGQANATGFNTFSGATNLSGLTTANAFTFSNYTGFTAAEWITVGGQTRPFLASEFSYAIGNAHQLQLMAFDLAGSYTLMRNIEASATGANLGTATTSNGMWTQEGFVPVGSNASPFTGRFDGQYHVVNGLTIDRANQNNIGLFGAALNATLVNVGLEGGSTKGQDDVGALVGFSDSGTIGNVYGTGNVSSAGSRIGGLVGYNAGGTVANVYTTGAVAGSSDVGGLVGYNTNGSISNSYVTGSATGGGNVGRLVGTYLGMGGVYNSFYATTNAGGIPINGGANGYGAGVTLAGLRQASHFSGWSISANGGDATLWRIYDGDTTPLLRGFLTPLMVNVTPDYNGSGNPLTNIGSATAGNIPSGPHTYGTGTVTQGNTLTLRSTQVGQYTATSNATMSGLYSDQQGYDISYSSATRTISTPGSAAGDLHLPSNITWSSGTLVIDIGGNVTTGGTGLNYTTISGDIFRLANGTWQQINNMPNGFSVNDFRLAGGTFLRAKGGDGSAAHPYLLFDVFGLQGMTSTALLGSNFALANDVDARGTANWNAGLGFVPVGNTSNRFTGKFDGKNHTIDDLTIQRNAQDYVGLFGYAGSGSLLANVSLNNASIQGGTVFVGALAGFVASGGTVDNTHVTGTVSGNVNVTRVGGLVGRNEGTIGNSSTDVGVSGKDRVGGLVGSSSGAISNSTAAGSVTNTGNYTGGLVGYTDVSGTISGSSASGTVTGSGNYVGGLVGQSNSSITGSSASGDVQGAMYVGGLVGSNAGAVSNSHASGTVTGSNNYVGGLIGFSTAGAISGSYATGAVSSNWNFAGGLVGGTLSSSTLTNSYATGAVSGNLRVGGLVGASSGVISNSYATGAVSSTQGEAGGLVGHNMAGGGSISNSYASGTVSGSTTWAGGLVGHNEGTVTGSYWNTDTSGFSTSAAGTGLSMTQMRDATSFSSWSLSNRGGEATVWRIYEGNTAPLLRSFLTTLTATANSGSRTYDGSVTGLGISYSVTPNGSLLLGTATSTLNDKNTGTRSASVSGLYSSQQGYDITSVGGTVQITPKALSVSGTTAAGKTYDGTTGAAITVGALSGFVGSETLTATASGTFDNKNAGSRTATARYTLADGANGGLAANYTLADTISHQATITPKALAISGTTAADKTYDGTTAASITIGSLAGLVGNERIEVTASGEFDAKDAGSRSATARYTLADGANGGLAANYTLADTIGHQATITPKALAISGTTAADKTYDGTTAASITIGSLTGLVGNERIEVTASGEFDAKDAGSRSATARYTLADGANGGLATNYRLADTTGHQATIRPRQVAADPAPHPGEHGYSGTLPGVHTQEGSRPAMPASGPEPYAIIGSGIRLPEGH